MKSEFLSAAKKEMKETILYYERSSKGLGLSFSHEINRMISLLKDQPELGQLIEKNVRRILTKKVSLCDNLYCRYRPNSHYCYYTSTPSS